MRVKKKINEIKPNDLTENFPSYFHSEPVIIRGMFSQSTAVRKWNLDFFKTEYGAKNVKVYKGSAAQPQTKMILLRDYLSILEDYEKNENFLPEEDQIYLFNFQLAKLGDALLADLNFNPKHLISSWYQQNWKRDLFFFFGSQHTRTRLHSDNLGTHNTFFQVYGSKKFVVAPHSEYKNCYIDFPKSTFSPIDLENPDFERFPSFKKAKFSVGTLNAGDILYMPPYTLHYVRGLSNNISLNIDWHDKKSIFHALSRKRVRGFICHYWNFISFLGIVCRIPNRFLYPFYKSQYR
jgi:hypothetical protein